jgi:hypothetical protein
MSVALDTANPQKAATAGRGKGNTTELATNPRTNYSDNWPSVTQRRYLMQQRSPLIFWLLLAATACVDLVAFKWVVYENSPDSNILIDALVSSELSIVCICSALRSKKGIGTWIAPWLAVVFAVGARLAQIGGISLLRGSDPPIGTPGEDQAFISKFHWSELAGWIPWYLPQFLFQAALLVAILWFFVRTSFWKRSSGNKPAWRFSLIQLLTITTVIAVLIVSMRESPLFDEDGYLGTLLWLGSTVALAIGAVVLWSAPWHWVLRLASVLALATVLGVPMGYYAGGDLGWHLIRNIAYYLIQAIVLSIWLALGPLPNDSTPTDAAGLLQ